MLVKVTSRRQVTLPAQVLDELGVKPGDQIELQEGPGGYLLKPRPEVASQPQIDYSKLGTLRDKIKPGTPAFDIHKLRDEGYDPAPYRD